MKKYLFFLLFLAIGAMSCQKDIKPTANSTSVVTPTKPPLFSQNKPNGDVEIIKKIKDFKALLDKIHSGTLPENSNEMTVNDAVWNVEALLNAQYCTADAPFKESFSGNGTIAVPLNTSGNLTQ